MYRNGFWTVWGMECRKRNGVGHPAMRHPLLFLLPLGCAEWYRQEYEAEMRELGLEAYDWDALCSENKDIKGWLCIPDTLLWIRTRRYGKLQRMDGYEQ